MASATAEEMLHITKLCSLKTLVDTFPPEEMHEFRYKVAWHQYHRLHLTSQLRKTLPMPTDTWRRSTNTIDSTPVWFTALRQRANRPSPTNRNLTD